MEENINDRINEFEEFQNIPWRTVNCRCHIIIKPEDVYFTYCTGWFVWRYREECKESIIWIN